MGGGGPGSMVFRLAQTGAVAAAAALVSLHHRQMHGACVYSWTWEASTQCQRTLDGFDPSEAQPPAVAVEADNDIPNCPEIQPAPFRLNLPESHGPPRAHPRGGDLPSVPSGGGRQGSTAPRASRTGVPGSDEGEATSVVNWLVSQLRPSWRLVGLFGGVEANLEGGLRERFPRINQGADHTLPLSSLDWKAKR